MSESLKYINCKDIISDKPNNSIRIMTYNVHGFMSRMFKHTKKEIIDNILSIDPDVLVLQEIYVYKRNYKNENELTDILNNHGYVYIKFSICGINLICSKLPINTLNIQEIDLGRDHIKKIKRNALICEFNYNKLDGTEDNVMCIGTHLDVFDESGATRIKQMNILVNWLKNKYGKDYDKQKIIIFGDMNSLKRNDYTLEQWKYIVNVDKKRGVNSIEDAISVLTDQKYVDSFDACKKSATVTVWAERRVDYIFGKNIDFLTSCVYKNSASDHYPVYGDVSTQ